MSAPVVAWVAFAMPVTSAGETTRSSCQRTGGATRMPSPLGDRGEKVNVASVTYEIV